jgi:hypothetical protein
MTRRRGVLVKKYREKILRFFEQGAYIVIWDVETE